MSIRLNLRIYLFITFVLIAEFSCSNRIATFGKTKIARSSDSLKLKQRISKIKSVESAIFTKGLFKGSSDTIIAYRLFKPVNANHKKLPLVIVFHGSDAVGNDNIKQLGILAKLFALKETQTKYPAFILAPQFPSRSSNYSLDKNRNLLTSLPQSCLITSLQLIDSLRKSLNIDQKRIYIVGFSMGASSVINALALKPNLFAAGISISGIPQFDKTEVLSEIPIWLIHGNIDNENPFSSDEQFFKEVESKNKIRFWELDNLSHNNIFATSFLGEEMPNWLFKNKLK